MSFLAPFYLLAAAAIALPILFHLIQRKPRGEQIFSSLMFLSPSPPKMVRRSRLDQWLLLLLRALALLAIAFAFMRPFFRSADTMESGALGRQRLILVDTSASMQRTGAWEQAQALVETAIGESTPQDLVAIYKFDSTLFPVVSFEAIQETPPAERPNLLRKAIADLKPSWNVTDMGRGIATAAETLQAAVNGQNDEESIGGEIILISDFAGAVNLSRLEDYDWPQSVRVVSRVIDSATQNNATLTPLAGLNNDEDNEIGLQLLLTNSPTSEVTQFQLQFLDSNAQLLPSNITPYQVTAGERRVIRLVDLPAQAISIQLSGDSDPSDNRVYFAAPKKRPTFVWLLQESTESNETQLGFFVERIPLGSSTLEVLFKRITPADMTTPPDPKEVALIIADGSIEENAAQALRSYADQGGKVVLALDQPITDSNKSRTELALKKILANDEIQLSEAAIKDYAMWSRINFKHPIFAPFADARFNDFTKVRTWRHRNITLPQSVDSPLAAYDDGTPAIQEIQTGEGRIWLFASGWQPVESQLALSTKFVPLLLGIFKFSGEVVQVPASLYAGDTLPVQPDTRCVSPDNNEISSNNSQAWELTKPGIYQLQAGAESKPIAVNIAPRELELSKLDPDRLEQLGVTTGALPTAELVRDQQRQMRNTELEKQQQVWRWCILIAVIFIAVETVWSSLSATRSAPAT